jgi:hypothetical protein
MTDAWIHLLEVAAKRCTCLTLSHNGGQVWASFQRLEKAATKWRSRPLRKGPFQALKKRLSLGNSRSQSSHLSAAYPHHSYALKTLIFQSNLFLLPPFSGWAFKVLNTAPLTRLDLIKVELPPRISTLVFEALTIPTLEHLRIIACQFRFNTLAEFLSRHHTISTFEIISKDVTDIQTIQASLPRATLPRLVSLKSNPATIVHLLTTSAFPKLAHVCVVLRSSQSDQFMFVTVEHSLAQAAKQLTKTSIQFCLDVLPTSPWVDLETLPNDLRNYPVLSRVREIAFDFPLPKAAAITSIPTWLSLFPLLEHIKFLNAEVGLDDQTKMSLLRRVVQKCATIRSVTIGEDTHDVSARLSSGND